MELKLWIWLLIIAGSFVANMMKKKRQSTAGIPSKSTTTPRPETRQPLPDGPLTFEDLLREIEGSRIPAPTPKPIAEKHDLPSPLAGRREVLEDTNYDYKKHDTIYDTYEQARKDAFLRPSLAETLKLQDTSVRFGAFAGYQRQRPSGLAAELAIELKRPSGFKKAFVMNEILQRRF